MAIHRIELLKGYGPLKFGMTTSEVREHLGEPEEEERIDEGEFFQSLIWHYWCLDVSVYFDLKENSRLTAIETDHHAATLWDTMIFQLPEQEIINLFRDHGYEDIESEMEGAEKCISFDEASADLYFREGRLSSINFGAKIEDDETITWPG